VTAALLRNRIRGTHCIFCSFKSLNKMYYNPGVHKSQVPGLPWWPNFVWLCQIFVGPLCGTWFMSPFWHLEFEVVSRFLEHLHTPVISLCMHIIVTSVNQLINPGYNWKYSYRYINDVPLIWYNFLLYFQEFVAG
jgi:hypothetical protein